MNGGTGNFLFEKAEAFALRPDQKIEHSAIHTSYFILHTCPGGLTAVEMVKYTAKK